MPSNLQKWKNSAPKEYAKWLEKQRARMLARRANPNMRSKMDSRPNMDARRALAIASGKIVCGKCKLEKPLSDFPPSRKNRKGEPRYSYCKACHCAWQRALGLKRNFNLTVEEYDLLFNSQNGRCIICGHPPKTMRLNVDHDHKTGLIRGLLCSFCNRIIGLFRDDPERIERAVKYLRCPPASGVLGAPRYGIKGRVSNKASTRRRLNRPPNDSCVAEIVQLDDPADDMGMFCDPAPVRPIDPETGKRRRGGNYKT